MKAEGRFPELPLQPQKIAALLPAPCVRHAHTCCGNATRAARARERACAHTRHAARATRARGERQQAPPQRRASGLSAHTRRQSSPGSTEPLKPPPQQATACDSPRAPDEEYPGVLPHEPVLAVGCAMCTRFGAWRFARVPLQAPCGGDSTRVAPGRLPRWTRRGPVPRQTMSGVRPRRHGALRHQALAAAPHLLVHTVTHTCMHPRACGHAHAGAARPPLRCGLTAAWTPRRRSFGGASATSLQRRSDATRASLRLGARAPLRPRSGG